MISNACFNTQVTEDETLDSASVYFPNKDMTRNVCFNTQVTEDEVCFDIGY